ncbi:act minimal PKS chain-length factor (CLF/KS beta) [Actinopolyspora mzabensis]|uniref:Act minimal PKS chain-length factor (CLF/KS beta) n=1 Tax=Actinopolyspora mzabensis TaxID=995066 RepID=A0A1G8ZBA6_ACTMZ|nr:ketosynthase chain-length factor [Actinopolyspora mzabensis]SDK12406.1 act minimal PKS chain-length factor (CLF/KS beta) [Actinopolyspora mzabensis]
MNGRNSSVVVTGLGIAAPNGLGNRNYWESVREGVSGIGRISHFDPSQYPSRLAGEVKGFVPEEHLTSRIISQTDRMTQLALVGTDCAFADARTQPSEFDEYEMGVVTASSSGGFEFGENELRNLWSQGGQYVSAYQSFAWFYAVNSGQISIRNGMRGPSGVVVSDQAGGLDAIAQARRQIRKGTRMIVSGGIDASLCPWGWTAQLTSRRLSTSSDPNRAYLPFDAEAAGHVPGEGGALVIMEDLASAHERRAPNVYGEISGYAATIDPGAGVESATSLQKAIEQALRNADADPAEIDLVFADAAAVPELDRAEAEALTKVFGVRGVPVTAPKTTTGRLGSGAASLDVATAFLAMRDGVIPPTPNVRIADEYDIDLVSEKRESRAGVRNCLVIARGIGGFNSAMVLRDSNQSSGR